MKRSKESMKFCPLIKKTCVGAKCAWWVEIAGVDQDGKTVLDEECSIPWLVFLGKEQLVETARTSASYDKVANMTAVLGNVITERVNPLPQ
jgi:hypothetical protein